MQSDRFSKLTITIVVLVSLAVLGWVAMRAAENIPLDLPEDTAPTSDIKTPLGTIRAMIASTSEATSRGLSGLASLPKDSGMLFVFPNAGIHGFWMKDMNFPIDMIWIDADQKVSGVTPGIAPETYPEIFYPPGEIKYVLELNSGGAKEHGIATGTKLVF